MKVDCTFIIQYSLHKFCNILELLQRFVIQVFERSGKLLLLRRTSFFLQLVRNFQIVVNFSPHHLILAIKLMRLMKQVTFGQSIYWRLMLKVLMEKLIMLMEHFQLLRTSKKNLFNRKKGTLSACSRKLGKTKWRQNIKTATNTTACFKFFFT